LIFRCIKRISAEIENGLGGSNELQNTGDEANCSNGVHEVEGKEQELYRYSMCSASQACMQHVNQ
jgi:hypothetical protein